MFGHKGSQDGARASSGPYPPPTSEERAHLLKSGKATVGLITEASGSPQGDDTTLWQLAVSYPDGKNHRDVQFADRLPDALQLHTGLHVPIRIGPANAIVDDVHLSSRASQERSMNMIPGQPVRPGDLPKVVIGAAQPKTWSLPATCPHCGAPVDQAVQSTQTDPRCHFCEEPLPVQ